MHYTSWSNITRNKEVTLKIIFTANTIQNDMKKILIWFKTHLPNRRQHKNLKLSELLSNIDTDPIKFYWNCIKKRVWWEVSKWWRSQIDNKVWGLFINFKIANIIKSKKLVLFLAFMKDFKVRKWKYKKFQLKKYWCAYLINLTGLKGLMTLGLKMLANIFYL
jgi:hypothetical protein